MNFRAKIELTDDDVVKIIFQHYLGQTFPVMLTYYDNGKYTFEGYDPNGPMEDVTPAQKAIDYVV
jgi:hypothetical protein